jgi:predicted Mrr-cat superfamily restriction endonuclease
VAKGSQPVRISVQGTRLDAPRLIVQVKSQDAKVDVKVLREFTGVMGKIHADHALLVGWCGFNHA